MTDTEVINKMVEYQFRICELLIDWLGKKLPRVTEDWWQNLVLNNLTDLQLAAVERGNISSLDGLDLAALLRVVDRNWFSLTSQFFINNRERHYVKDMMTVRNNWAHIAAKDITKKRVMDDLSTVINLMQTLDAPAHEVREVERFLGLVEDDDDLSIDRTDFKEHKAKVDRVIQNDDFINVGDLVVLVNDPSVVGAVNRISGNRYTVLINSRLNTYYGEQIRKLQPVSEDNLVPLSRVRTALTAYQINNPGASNLYSLNSARIDFVPYQFRPALKMIKADVPRLLVADDVGVGKTIEAGLILKELEARSSINSVLVICPRPLIVERKWEEEMKRFDERFVHMDSRNLTEALSDMHRDGVWPDRYNKIIIPYSLFGEDLVSGTHSTSRRRKRIGLEDLDPFPHFDLVIVDEAHTIRNQSTWMYQGVEMFCKNAEAVIMLTATPLQNSNNDLYTLLNLLRPDIVIDKNTFDTMSEPNEFINNLLRIIRTQQKGWQAAGKQEITRILGTSWGREVIQHSPEFEKVYNYLEKKEPTRDEKVDIISCVEELHSFHCLINRTRRRDIEDFCVRRTQTIQVSYNSIQKDLHDAIMDFERTSLSIIHGSRSVRFMMCTIMRQASSCIYGIAPFLEDLIQKRMTQVQEDGELYEYDFNLNSDDENALFELADEIRDLADRLPKDDPKFDRLLEVINAKQKEDNNRIIIFSSFRHTLRYIKERLNHVGIRVGQIDGSVPDEERYKLRERFRADRDDQSAIDVLLFTEVGCEGLDYQFCDTMINYDLPWNPMRIEQRIGRIDRRGQKADTVRIYNMITEDTIDATVYHRCLSKIGVFEASIGDCSEILGDISDQIMKIMFEPGLTEEERRKKIEIMADAEVLKVQEMQRLEQEEKSLFGFDLSNYMQNKEVQDAESAWINQSSIQELVEAFLHDYLGDTEYIRGKSELKNMRISMDKRRMLAENLMSLNIVNSNNALEQWNKYLKSQKPTTQVTFDSVCAKDNRDALFLNQMHPLVLQAAAYESQELPCEVGISVVTDDLPAGDYDFLIYVWKYMGFKPDVQLVAISDNDVVQKNVLSYFQFSDEYEYDDSSHVDKWEIMDQIHYDLWQTQKNEYISKTKADCDYRLERLSYSYRQREAIYRRLLNSNSDERIRRMRQSQLDKLSIDYNEQKQKLESIQKSVDIHTNLQVKGVLHVEKPM